MKKSKKLLALLLCLAMVFGLAACGNSNKPANSLRLALTPRPPRTRPRPPARPRPIPTPSRTA